MLWNMKCVEIVFKCKKIKFEKEMNLERDT